MFASAFLRMSRTKRSFWEVSDDLGCRSGEEDTKRGEKKGEEKVDMK